MLPSIRWALRRHTLPDDEPTRYLLRDYILSAFNIAGEFAALLQQVKPQSAVIFNGHDVPRSRRPLGLPASWACASVTHEVGFQRFSAFFTEGEATAYPIDIPPDFELNDRQNALIWTPTWRSASRGSFTMAGIRFWPEMRGLDEAFLQKAAGFRQIVPVFTNVIYDTSQVHANTVFPHMFAWLDAGAGDHPLPSRYPVCHPRPPG